MPRNAYLPTDLPTPPVYSKSNPADAPVITLALTSKALPLSAIEDLVDTRLAPKISQLSGVGLVTISGGNKPAVRIQANPVALASYGLNLEDLRNALTSTTVNMAKGTFDGPAQAFQINANDQLLSAAGYRDVVVRVQERRTRHAVRCRQDHRRHREREAGRMEERYARDPHQHSAATGREHHCRGQRSRSADAQAESDAPRFG